jgi:transposase-like protein
MSNEQEMNLVELIERYGSEDRSRARLEELRWPEGVECPRCNSKSIVELEDRHQYQCRSCRYQFSVTAGTIFHDTHLPLWKWFLAVYLIVESKKGISANQLKRTLNVSYKTAWYLCHRIRAALDEVDASPKHLDAYLDELEYRYNNRENPYMFRDAMLRLLLAETLSYAKLIEN